MDEKTFLNGLKDLLDHTIYIGKTSFANISITPSEITKFCCVPLLIKAMHKAHAINLLVSEDLLEEAEIIERVLIEVSFIIGAIDKNPKFAIKYGKSAYAQKLRSLKNIQQGIGEKIPNLEVSNSFQQALQKKIDLLKTKIKDEKLKDIKIYDYAKEAGLLAIYYSAYSKLCSSVHSGPEDLESYFSKEINGSILKISAPVKNNKDVILFSSIEAVIRILKSLSSIFSIESDNLKKAEEVYHGISAILWEKNNPNQYFK